ncbi:hypothetical protein ACOBQB_15085 [Streptomyces sp. G5(2025)]|uniref:hypothetical protein n=1 Tax=Streptomyces sp. G5(2025) TaxID=3406628 RepID=UPI003C2324C2
MLGSAPKEDSDFFAAGDEPLRLLRLRQRISQFAEVTPSADELSRARTFGRMADLLTAP